MDEDIRQELRDLRQELRAARSEQDALTRQVTRLVSQLQQDDELQERAEHAAREERDARHKTLVESLSAVSGHLAGLTSTVNGIGSYLRGLPARLLAHVEKEIYKLRSARWEANRPGQDPEPMPLPPVQRVDPTGRFVVPAPPAPTLPVPQGDLALTPAQQRKILGWLWHAGKAVLTNRLAQSGMLLGAWEVLRHGLGWLKDHLPSLLH